jgi:glycerophosphoryl diester phosphodiesterase
VRGRLREAGLVTTALLAAGAGVAGVPSASAAPPTTDSRPSPSRLVKTPTLQGRAVLSADYSAPGPDSGALATPKGAVNGRTGPFKGQVVPGFSGVVADKNGTYWAMPDNGFGSKANSADFLLRVYKVKPDLETAKGGSGAIKVQRFISLRDPRHLISFPIVNEHTTDRLLTGADFDIESIVRQPDGTFWIGEEFGPYLLHVSRSGVLLSAPVPFVGGKSPDNPTLGTATPAIASSKGFEAMAGSKDGRYLYPILEGALNADTDKRRRVVYEFDTRKGRYTSKTWAYETDTDADLVGDAHLVGKRKLVVLERDNFDGPQAVIKRVYDVDLNRRENGYARKRLVVDLLKIANPQRIGVESSPGAYGVGSTFSFAFQSTETVVPLSGGRYLFANDNNYPNNSARHPGTPDDTEMVVVGFPKVRTDAPTVRLVGHRGASGYRPEHTLASYELAIQQCADYIEPDVVPTKDGRLVARHENNIVQTTDVADHPEFASRKTRKVIDGVSQTGWFTEDFTLAELRTLHAKERLPEVRPNNATFDGLYPIPTLDEVFDLAKHSRSCSGKPVGVAPETKHPTYFRSIGLPTDDQVVAELRAHGWTKKSDPVVIQSFETGNLASLAKVTKLPLIQLVDCSGAPYDLKAAGSATTYADLVTPEGLKGIKRYADQVALCKDVMIPRDTDGRLLAPTPVIRDAHRAGLTITGWTFRRENQFLPLQYRSSTDPNAVGDLNAEIETFLDAGMDNFFTDDPDVGQEART